VKAFNAVLQSKTLETLARLKLPDKIWNPVECFYALVQNGNSLRANQASVHFSPYGAPISLAG